MHMEWRWGMTTGPPRQALSKVWPQEHFPTPVLNLVALRLKLLFGILTSDKLLYILFHQSELDAWNSS